MFLKARKVMSAEEVQSFLDKMDRDMAEINRMEDAENRLFDSIKNYEKVFGVKIKLPLVQDAP